MTRNGTADALGNFMGSHLGGPGKHNQNLLTAVANAGVTVANPQQNQASTGLKDLVADVVLLDLVDLSKVVEIDEDGRDGDVGFLAAVDQQRHAIL